MNMRKGSENNGKKLSTVSKRTSPRRKPLGILGKSVIIRNKWKTLSRLGQGAFGEIYSGIEVNTCDEVAVKVEKADSKRMFLKLETYALRKLQSSNNVVRYISSGKQDHFNFLVMERLGDNLAQLRKKQEGGNFSLSSTIKLGIQMIDAVESVHNLGYLHRDIKPSNFCIGKKKSYSIFLIDFNLARRFTLSTGAIRPPRKRAGFRGTARYASYNAHLENELSRRDDLWSALYVLVEFTIGDLPWKGLKDKQRIGDFKRRFQEFELDTELETEFTLMLKHLKELKYEDQPNYDFLRQQLYHLYNRQGFQPNQPMDWVDPVDHNPVRRHSLAEQIVAEQFFHKNYPERKVNKRGRRHSVEPVLSRKDQLEFEKFLEEKEKELEEKTGEKEEEIEDEKNDDDSRGSDSDVYYSSFHPSNVRVSERWGDDNKKNEDDSNSGDKLCCCNIL